MGESNATRWYATREAVKAAPNLKGPGLNQLIDSYIEAASEDVDEILKSRGQPVTFIPITRTRYYRWPQSYGSSLVLDLGADLLAITGDVLVQAQDASPVTLSPSQYFLEPATEPPFRKMEINLAGDGSFRSGNTPQRSIAIPARWGYSQASKAAGTVASGLASDAGATSMVCSDASKIGVGDTLLIESEALFVSEREMSDTTADLTGDVASSMAATTIPIDSGAKVKLGEVIQVDSERMLVEAVIGNNLTVQRAYDASTLAAHSSGASVFASRALTVVRGVNGTTAAVHANDVAIARYAPPADIVEYVRAYAIAHHEQGKSGWTGAIGGDESGTVETRMFGISKMRNDLKHKYGRLTF